MRTYKLTIAYDGSRYQGWQRQSNTDKTVQGLLEQAASETAGYPQKFHTCVAADISGSACY